MSARDEFPSRRIETGDLAANGVWLAETTHAAMCDRMDTLTAENAELRADLDMLNDEICECKVLEVTAELRSLRAAVSEWKKSPQGFKHDLELEALVPSDGSWETEQ